jgi:hypothetical protein
MTIVLLFASLGLRAYAGASLEAPNLPGEPPAPNISKWLRLRIIGNTFQPARPIIWISPQAFETTAPDQLAVLTRREYTTLSNFAHSYRCSKNGVIDAAPDTLLITEYALREKRTICVLPRATACEFLEKMASAPGIYWSATRSRPIRNLSTSIGCGRT